MTRSRSARAHAGSKPAESGAPGRTRGIGDRNAKASTTVTIPHDGLSGGPTNRKTRDPIPAAKRADPPPQAWIPGPPVYLSDPAPCGCKIDQLNEPHDLIDYGGCEYQELRNGITSLIKEIEKADFDTGSPGPLYTMGKTAVASETLRRLRKLVPEVA